MHHIVCWKTYGQIVILSPKSSNCILLICQIVIKIQNLEWSPTLINLNDPIILYKLWFHFNHLSEWSSHGADHEFLVTCALIKDSKITQLIMFDSPYQLLIFSLLLPTNILYMDQLRMLDCVDISNLFILFALVMINYAIAIGQYRPQPHTHL